MYSQAKPYLVKATTYLFLILMPLIGWAKDPTNKREMRGVWIATVNNIDWPSRDNLDATQQKKEVAEILDHHQKQGINAIFFQVRPSGDAFYSSNSEPWSQWLGGLPTYDPLTYWVEQCHQRGMEFHAWFNPKKMFTSSRVQVALTTLA